MKTVKSCNEVAPKDVGSYIRFGGRGIIDGLKGKPSKAECHLVTGVDAEGIHTKSYRRRKGSFLPPGELRAARRDLLRERIQTDAAILIARSHRHLNH